MGFFDIFKKENNAKADLSSSDILMISFANKYVSGKDVPRYWKYTYNVDNVFSLIDSLKKRGYIDANGFPTEAGKEVLSKNEYVLYFHKTKPCEIPLEVMEKLVSEHPNTPYRDLIWGEWNRLLLEHMKELNFGSFRNIKYAMHKFLVEEKRFVESIPFLAEAFYFDLNNDFSPFIAPALVEDLKNIVNKTNLKEEDLEKIVLSHVARLSSIKTIFPNNVVAKIIVSFAYGRDEEANKMFDSVNL